MENSFNSATWHGFNILDFFDVKSPQTTSPALIQQVANWGFNFIRIPIDYQILTNKNSSPQKNFKDLLNIIDVMLKQNIHVNICMHAAPGYSVNKTYPEEDLLWNSAVQQKRFLRIWNEISTKFLLYPSALLSYNLINEPPQISDNFKLENYVELVIKTIELIRGNDNEKAIFVDGVDWGRTPINDLNCFPNTIQSCRAYDPFSLTHYRASWVDNNWELAPEWPLRKDGHLVYGPHNLKSFFSTWEKVISAGNQVHCGEFGCFNKTPHAAMLKWMEDVLQIMYNAKIGWALWNLDGPFGIINSNRKDSNCIKYDFGCLDVPLLNLLVKFNRNG